MLWNGEVREIRVIATVRRPLLDEQELVIQLAAGGLVTIQQSHVLIHPGFTPSNATSA